MPEVASQKRIVWSYPAVHNSHFISIQDGSTWTNLNSRNFPEWHQRGDKKEMEDDLRQHVQQFLDSSEPRLRFSSDLSKDQRYDQKQDTLLTSEGESYMKLQLILDFSTSLKSFYSSISLTRDRGRDPIDT